MHTAESLTTTTATLRRIKRLAAAAKNSREDESRLYFALQSLPPQELAEIHALFILGRGGHRSFNVALAAARNQNPEHVPGSLADNSRLVTYLNKGLKRYASQS